MTERLAERLRTVQLVTLTAFDAAGQLNLEPMRTHSQRLVEAGIRVLIPCAGTSEFHSLADEEIIDVVRATREAIGDRAVVVAPTGGAIHRAISLANVAAQAGADAVLVMPLSFPYLSDSGARDYYFALLDRLHCPALVYKKADIPSDDLLLELAEHPNLIGVKYAVNNMDHFNRVVTEDAGRIDWYCGSAERFAPFYCLAGATGYTSGAGNVCPRLTLAMHAALAAGDWPEAMRLQQLILPIERFRARAGDSYNISMLKHAIKHTGLDFGLPRPPQRQLTAAEEQEIDELLLPILAAEKELAAPAPMSS